MSDDLTGDMTSAVESAFAAASTPDASTTTTVESTAPSTTETATTDVSQAAAQTTEGPVPYPRFKEVNDGYQTSKKELEALQWAKSIRTEDAQAFAQFYQAVRQDPLNLLHEVDALMQNPATAPAVRSWAARTLGTRMASQPTQAAEDVMPEPDLQFEDGRRAYSDKAQQQRDQWLLRQLTAQMDERIAPLQARGKQVDQIVADKEISRIKAQATVDARTEIDTLKAQPHFETHRKDIAAEMEADPALNLRQAWAKVFAEKVIPKLAGQHAATVTRKVVAGSANPARPSGASTSAPTDFVEALTPYFPAR